MDRKLKLLSVRKLLSRTFLQRVLRGGWGIADVDSWLYGAVCSLPMRFFKNCIDAIHIERHMNQVICLCNCNCIVMLSIAVLSDELA
jgi:hypothetical protein